jgi:flagellar hook protein FlgE
MSDQLYINPWRLTMALLNSLFSGVSGLQNLQTMMDVIGDNISNIDTIGYKSSDVTFSDTFNDLVKAGANATSTTGGTNSFQVGLGMKINSIDKNFTQGTFETTGVTTDLALQGNGMFILNSNGQNYYSRAGAFTFDSDGKLVDSSGDIVQGKVANGAGEISAGSAIQDIQIDQNMKLPAVSTAKISWSGNLQSSSATIQSTLVALDGNLNSSIPTTAQTYPGAAYDASDSTNTNKTYQTSTIYGKDGTAYTLRTWYTEDTSGNWTANYDVYDSTNTTEVLTAPGSQVLAFNTDTGSCTTSQVNVTDSTGNLNFNLNFASLTQLNANTSTSTQINNGETEAPVTAAETVYDSLGNAHTLTLTFNHLNDGSWTWSASMPTADGTLASPSSGEINFDSSGSILSIYQGGNQITTTPPEPSIVFTPANGAKTQQMTLNFGENTSGITQTSLTSQVAATSQDGSAAATLSNINIDQYGNIVGVFSNGNSETLAQVMVATFANTNGLVSAGSNLYSVAANSGQPQVSAPGEDSGTTIQSGALEQSNVDLSAQFSDMIVAQRGFEANSKVIQTADEMLQVITGLIR